MIFEICSRQRKTRMPDITLQTLSATETPALWGLSPYVTRWMLYQRFANGVRLDAGENARMSWGRKLQPLVIAQAAEELRLKVQPNHAHVYHRRGRLGSTRDATMLCPDRGPGALETKCVFDYATWMREWDGGRNVPPMHEIQLQQQMKVGDENGPYRWGVIAVWVAGDLYLFRARTLHRILAAAGGGGGSLLCGAVAAKSEPDPAASCVVEKVSRYNRLSGQECDARKAKERLRAELLALARDHEEVALPGGITFKVATRSIPEQTRKGSLSKTLTVTVPEPAGASLASRVGRDRSPQARA
jgi:hypothetical protein